MSGRGDMEIGVYQFSTKTQNNMTFLANAVNASPVKGFALMPPWSRDPMKHEVDRAVKVTNDKRLNVVSFTLVNRTGLFQPELHPPFPGNVPNNTVKAWLKGEDKPAKLT